MIINNNTSTNRNQKQTEIKKKTKEINTIFVYTIDIKNVQCHRHTRHEEIKKR